jgi:small subunit ribosomal protein S9
LHFSDYFTDLLQLKQITLPFQLSNTLGKYNCWAVVHGGGKTSQVNALTTAIARGLCIHEPELQPILDHLTKSDTRQVERKKTGQPKARKKNAWVKR